MVLPQVQKEYVDTGKVELIYLDLPLHRPPDGWKPAEAAACAGDQGKFWEMRHHLFANQTALAPDRLPGHAEALGLDVAAFRKCLSGGRHAAGIREDIRKIRFLGIAGTPAFLLGRRLPGGDKVQIEEIVKGLQPYEVIKAKLDGLLAPE